MNIDEDDTKLFRLLEPGEFGIYTQSDELPVSDCPVYLMEGVGGICLSGTATVQVFSHRFRIVRGMVLALFPWQLISIKEVSDDFGIRFFRISHDMFTDTLSSLWRARPGFFFYMRTHIASEPREEYVGRFLNFCDLLAYRAENAPVICRRESVMQLLRVFYWDVYTIYLNDPQAEKTAYTHKEELAFRFMRTVVEEHSPNRDVAYFAERLGITPKYLTNLKNELCGQSARDWIDGLEDDRGACQFSRPVYPEPLFPQVHGHVPVPVSEEYSFLSFKPGGSPASFFVECRAEMF